MIEPQSQKIIDQAGCYPCCGADTFGEHREKVSEGLCSKERFLRALDAAAEAMENDDHCAECEDRFCAECGADVIGNDPHGPRCSRSQ